MKEDISGKMIAYLASHPASSSKAIHEGLESEVSYATIKRLLTKLEQDKLIISEGKGKATRYSDSPAHRLLAPFDLQTYFKKEIDQRDIQPGYNFELIPCWQALIFLQTQKRKNWEISRQGSGRILQSWMRPRIKKRWKDWQLT